VLAIAGDTGHTRLPVFHEDLDHVVGIVHVKDLLTGETADRPVADLLRPVPAVPESRDLESLLKQMLEDRAHVALVVDEYGGTAGVVTLEDILEELVGDIEDEFDAAGHTVRRVGAGRHLVKGSLRVDRVPALFGEELPEGEYETVAGFVLDQLGHIPEPGEVVVNGRLELTVTRVEAVRIVEVAIRRLPDEPETGGTP
jgi:CBS domain containing-hemolysin-like protein